MSLPRSRRILFFFAYVIDSHITQCFEHTFFYLIFSNSVLLLRADPISRDTQYS